MQRKDIIFHEVVLRREPLGKIYIAVIHEPYDVKTFTMSRCRCHIDLVTPFHFF